MENVIYVTNSDIMPRNIGNSTNPQLKNSNKYHKHSIIKQGYKTQNYEQLNSLENNINDTNNNNSLSKDYNTENYSFLGCVIKNNSNSQVTNEITNSSHNDFTAWILIHVPPYI
ncbi:hypothetical protein LY90DRAFT_519848 [Neocallimastix californiae]|uniref:Uncharacterized protein n=1 Tax=Neocallimastix californiae TaxID=1754190 RepID=A0A1Y1YPS9_9FUNG|nr:hypothetical protein LY90DRAFT_519848 [Neocallimastix californiae]|eukprot:ORX99975.1 hypothetical protein LY90DRAFT_519848 [Neocallimastix californiae]